MLRKFEVAGYRSLCNLRLDVGPTTVVVGANGTGKSNLYRSLQLVHDAASGRLARTVVGEGGLPSVLSATESPSPGTELRLAVRLDEWRYELVVGLVPAGAGTAFRLDPCVRSERLDLVTAETTVAMLERSHDRTVVRDPDGRRLEYFGALDRSEAALGQLHDPMQFPELAALRQRVLGWRFYHQFRTDEGSPLRRPQRGVFTPVLAHDGNDLAAALQTILEQEPAHGAPTIAGWLARAFPGVSMDVACADGEFEVQLAVPRVSRLLRAAELSDGQLRFLCLLAALSSPRPPALLVLNEPETSLHPDVLPVLGECIAAAAAHSQIVVTTHARSLATAIASTTGTEPIELELRRGETRIRGRGRYE
jgi:predicted ATPase